MLVKKVPGGIMMSQSCCQAAGISSYIGRVTVRSRPCVGQSVVGENSNPVVLERRFSCGMR